MNAILRNTLAVAGLAIAAPASAWTVWPDVDFEWYANVGKPVAGAMQAYPAARPGFIWAPNHWETRGTSQSWVAGQWIRDDYAEQHAAIAHETGLLAAYDSRGDVIPGGLASVDSARR